MTLTNIHTRMILDRWDASLKHFSKLVNEFSDEDLNREVSPGKNRGIYLLGHMIAVHDDLLPLLDMGEKQHPELNKPFHDEADKVVNDLPSAVELRKLWAEQCTMLKEKFDNLSAEQWLERHTSISPEDFIKEPHRNKLNVILTRINHLAYHTGQLALLK